MNVSDNKRVREVIFFLKENKKIRNQQQFCEEIGVNKAIISQIINEKLQVSNKMFRKIANTYPFIEVEWLLTGKGDMIKSENTTTQTFKGDNNISVSGNNNSNIHSGTDKDATDTIQQLNSVIALLKAEIETKNKQIDTLLSILQNNGKQ